MKLKSISKPTFIVLLAAAFLIGTVSALLATSNIINVTVTPAPVIPPTTQLAINGTSTAQYSGTVHPGDKLVLVATSTPVNGVVGKTITFFNNAAYPIGTQTVNDDGIATLTWTVPALTSGGIISGSDVYAFRAELS
jgi:hypothetical protein